MPKFTYKQEHGEFVIYEDGADINKWILITDICMEMNNIIVDPTYKQWVVDIERRFRQQQIKAVVQVNSCKIEFYWSLGRDICEMDVERR